MLDRVCVARSVRSSAPRSEWTRFGRSCPMSKSALPPFPKAMIGDPTPNHEGRCEVVERGEHRVCRGRVLNRVQVSNGYGSRDRNSSSKRGWNG
eukprot:scaffold519_cov331-Pavlova_lutheri.AAC.3